MSVINENSSGPGSLACADPLKLANLCTVQRITSLPVIESAAEYYVKLKNLNFLVKWSLKPVEFGIWVAIESTQPIITFFEKPVKVVDKIVCESLGIIEDTFPCIAYPPDYAINLINTKVVQPVMQRADAVIQITATNLCYAVDVADTYVDKYLPDSCDTEEPTDLEDKESKMAQAILHVNRISRKLQYRMTHRIIAEAKALIQLGIDTAQRLLHFVYLLVSNQKKFLAEVEAMWAQLSQDEPENQVPPGNMAQRVDLLTREMARSIVHFTNYTVNKAAGILSFIWENIIIKYINIVDRILQLLNLGCISDVAARLFVKAQEIKFYLLELLSTILSNQPAVKESSTLPEFSTSPQQPSSPNNSRVQYSSQPTSPTSESEYHDQ